MFKLGLKILEFFKSFVQFLKIVLVFSSMLFCLYWVQQLTGSEWSWFVFVKPLVIPFVDGARLLFSPLEKFVPFPSQEMFVIVLYIIVFFMLNLLLSVVDIIQGIYENANQQLRKFELKQYNKSIKKEQTEAQTKLNIYKILIKTELKQKFSRTKTEKDVEEQNKIMLEFLTSKLNTSYVDFEGSYLFELNRFYDVDKVLDVLFKIIKSDSILNYQMAIQIVDGGNYKALQDLVFLNHLNFSNKICILTNTVYRYGFNVIRKYNCISLGIFQKEQCNAEVFEFKENL